MEVVRNTKYLRRVHFSSLDVGDVYESNDGYLCIKTTEVAGYGNCITYYDDPRGWETSEESMNALIRPIQATLTINEEEEEEDD